MERKVYDFFEKETMPEDCARRIESSMIHHHKPVIQWRRFAAAAAALVLVLALFNAEAICATADSILDEITHALKPETQLKLNRDIGRVANGAYHVHSDLFAYHSGSSVSWSGSCNFVEVADGRLYFTGNEEYIDITDLCSMEEAYVYPLNSGDGIIHYLCVGGTPDKYGYFEFIFDMTDEVAPWKTGGGFYQIDPESEEPYGWVHDLAEKLDCPWLN